MNEYEANGQLSIQQLELRFWYQVVTYKHFFYTFCAGVSLAGVKIYEPDNIYLANAFLFLLFSSLLSFTAYLIISSDSFHRLYHSQNIETLNMVKMFEYSMSAPITILCYTALIPIANWSVELFIYSGLVANVLTGGILNLISIQQRLWRSVVSLLGFITSLATFGTIVYYMQTLDFSTNWLIYVIISIFVLSRIRYFVFFLNKNKDEDKKYIWINKNFINMDLHDRLYLLISLILVAFFR